MVRYRWDRTHVLHGQIVKPSLRETLRYKRIYIYSAFSTYLSQNYFWNIISFYPYYLTTSISNTLIMFCATHAFARPGSISLPSFTELVTSIPLPSDFKAQISRYSAPSSPSAAPSPSYSGSVASSPLSASYGPSLTPPIELSSASLSHYQFSVPKAATPSTSTASSPVIGNHRLHTVSKEIKRKHVCKVCARSFTTSGHLARHNRIHTGERKHVCPWPSCGARFARQDNCMQHYKTHTNGKTKRSKLSFSS